MSIRNEVLALHRAARAELREGLAALARVNGYSCSQCRDSGLRRDEDRLVHFCDCKAGTVARDDKDGD